MNSLILIPSFSPLPSLSIFSSAKIDTLCTDMNRGEKFENGTWGDLLGMLRNDECDFVVGGFFPDFDVHDDFGVTDPYFQNSYTW